VTTGGRAALVVLLLAGCASQGSPPTGGITADGLMAHIRTLASDEFEGRAPGTAGEEKTIQYLADQFRQFGLTPGNPDGSWLQPVSMVGFTAAPSASFSAGGRTVTLRFPDDYVAVSRRHVAQVVVPESELVFVGYGVIAPEFQWDDYKGLDVRGKTIVMLINDPAVPDPSDSTRLDPASFRGQAMTYYGRWTYKYEIATEKGAAAAIIVHETGPAGYPYEVIRGSWSRENIEVKRPDGYLGRVAIESWMTDQKARELFRAAGQDFDALKRAARGREFRPVTLGATATFRLENTLRDLTSHNVIAKLEGKDPALKDQYLIYTAHWDHLGRDPAVQGDQIYNGAHDNASGTAALLELARSFAELPERPARTMLFLAVTAEEKGLLGAKYYAENPLYPLERTLANLNIDGINQWGRTRDVVVVGAGNTTLEDLLAEAARSRGRVIVPDPEPGKGFFYRSDQFELVKKGVPALYLSTGTDFIGRPAGFGLERRAEYTANDYHKPSDEVKPDWDLSGAAEDLGLLFEVGLQVANGVQWPEWKPGTEFKAIREAMVRR
jgi:Zn-dependent M28 family amino/carboxypeptidase